uniref:hypothetical protein n=1 Tax=Amycolatopsis sp. CA-096443 TaxID=3239919 RepID=UPI003F498D53
MPRVADDRAVPDPPDMLADLTDVERAVIDCARRGETYECARDTGDPAASGQADGPQNAVRGALLRELLLGWHGELHPRGVQLVNARITEELNIMFATATAGLNLDCCEFDWPVRLRHARMPWLFWTGCGGPCVDADDLHVDGNLFLRNSVWLRGIGGYAPVQLRGAHIGGTLDLAGTRLVSETGTALDADGLRVDGSAHFTAGFTADGHSERGTVNLRDAVVGGRLTFAGARLTNDAGPALHLGDARIGDSLMLRDGFSAVGRGQLATLRLYNTRVHGDFALVPSELTNEDGPLVSLFHAHCSSAGLSVEAICPVGRKHTGGRPCPDADRIVNLTGFTCDDLLGTDWRHWLHLVRHHSPQYQQQPYQHLAAICTAAGHDEHARRVLVTQQHHRCAQDRNRLSGGVRRVWGAMTGWHGYRVFNTVVALAVVLIVAGGLGILAGHITTTHGFAAQRLHHDQDAIAAEPSQCSLVELFGLGIDRGLPLGSTGMRTRCDLDTATRSGQVFTVLLWPLQGLAWVCVTWMAAGCVARIRKIR